MLTLTYAGFATIEELFRYKSQGFRLELFPGYTSDQWGIKAHNRPWVVENGEFSSGQKVIEVGGAYSTLPKYLGQQYALEAWIGDDFGGADNEHLWTRWGNPLELPRKHPSIKYVFEPFGVYSKEYPDQYFDRIFSVSTLEHIPLYKRLDVFKDMNRCTKLGGMQLHTIDISTNIKRCLIHSVTEVFSIISLNSLSGQYVSEVRNWIKIIKDSGVKIACPIPYTISLFNRKILVESPDVVYRFFPPNNAPKLYAPHASLLLVIEDL